MTRPDKKNIPASKPVENNRETDVIKQRPKPDAIAAIHNEGTPALVKKTVPKAHLRETGQDEKNDDTFTVTINKGQLYEGKVIETDDELNRFAENQMGLTQPRNWNPKYSNEQVKDIVTNGQDIKYRFNTNDIAGEVERLPAEKKDFLNDPENLASAVQKVRLLDLLKQLSAEEIADYKSKTTAENPNPAAMEKSLRAYIKTRNLRKRETDKRLALETSLKKEGILSLYKRYKEYSTPAPVSISATTLAPVSAITPKQEREKAAQNEQFLQDLKANGFTLASFRQLIENYEHAFRRETLNLADDVLQKYRHTLFEQQKQLTDNAFLDRLLGQIKQSGAKQSYQKAADARSVAQTITPADFKLTPHEAKMKMDYNAEASAQTGKGNAAVSGLSNTLALINDNGFDKEAFAKINTKAALKSFVESYILKQESNVTVTLKNLKEDGGLNIYVYTSLLDYSKKQQGIQAGDILDLIITDKEKAESARHVINALVIGVLAIALGLLTFGTGTVALLLAAGNFALGAYLTVEEIDAYQTQLAAYKVNISKDEPKAVWVVLSVVGSVLDVAAVAKISDDLIRAGRVFEETKDVTKASKILDDTTGLDKATKEKVVEALENQNKKNDELIFYNDAIILEDGVPPLTDDIANTFLGRKYRGFKLTSDRIFYRSGEKGKPLGQFYSEEIPLGVIQTRIDKAILPKWPSGVKSTLNTIFEIKIPSGTTVYVGEVASQGGIYLGGTTQIFISKPWTLEGIEVLNSFPLK